MHKIYLEHECGCFRKSNFENNIVLAQKDDALMKAIEMTNSMNKDFCGKHEFHVMEENSNFLIAINQQAPQQKSGCCGGGCGH